MTQTDATAQLLTRVVRIRNTGSEPFKGLYDNERYTLQPGEEGVFPYGAMVQWTGRPDMVNQGMQRDRLKEVQRLRVLYGAYEDEFKWESNRPELEVFTLDGKRVITVLDDPEGNSLRPAERTVDQERFLRDQVAALEAQLATVQDKLSMDKTPEPDGSPTSPKKMPRRSRQSSGPSEDKPDSTKVS